MTNPPVYYVLGQLRFNPILLMDNEIPKIQEFFRKERFPRFDVQEFQNIPFGSNQSLNNINGQLALRKVWHFTNTDSTEGYILGIDSIVYQTTKYTDSEEFIKKLIQGLRILNNVFEFEFLSRAGMRYLDAVVPEEGHQLDEYLIEGTKGITFSGQIISNINESVFESDLADFNAKGTLISRTFRKESEIGYAPDLLNTTLVIDEKFRKLGNIKHALIDSDYFVEFDLSLDYQKVEDLLMALHLNVSEAFKKSCSPFAKERWA